jgi:hypothetical protein
MQHAEPDVLAKSNEGPEDLPMTDLLGQCRKSHQELLSMEILESQRK